MDRRISELGAVTLIVCFLSIFFVGKVFADNAGLGDQTINKDTKYDIYFAVSQGAGPTCIKNVKGLERVTLYGITYLMFVSTESKSETGYVIWGDVVAIVPTGVTVERKVDYVPVQLK